MDPISIKKAIKAGVRSAIAAHKEIPANFESSIVKRVFGEVKKVLALKYDS